MRMAEEREERPDVRGEQTQRTRGRGPPTWTSSRETRDAEPDKERGAERYMAKMQAKHDKEMEVLHDELAALAREAMRRGVHDGQ